MKSLEDLRALKKKAQEKTKLREGQERVKIIVTMGTCGIASGARDVVVALMEELKKRNITDVTLTQTGCIGMCEKEPIVIVEKEGKKTAYGKISPDKAVQIINQHIVNNQVVGEWVIEP